ncbi:MAG: carboxypeptidase-like regulatory domain-containing protein [Bacteroidota bacterium]
MTIREKNKQTMGNSETETFDQYNGTWQASQIFSDSVQRHKDNMLNISIWENKQMEALQLRGLVQSKNLLRLIITATDERVVAGLFALSALTNNPQLASSVNFRQSFSSMSDPKFLSSSNKVKEVADLNASALIPLGISTQILTNLGLDLVAFDSIIKKPKALRGQVTVFTKNLNDAVKTMFTFLRKTVKYQVKSLFAGSDFEAAFTANSKVYNYNQHETILRGKATDTNGKHVKNVLIEMVNYPSPGESTFRSTNSNGNYAYKHIDCTSATLRVRALGYTNAEYIVAVTKGKETVFNLLLIPEPAPVPAHA